MHTLRNEVADFVRDLQDVTIPELLDFLGERIEISGDQQLSAAKRPDIIFWVGIRGLAKITLTF